MMVTNMVVMVVVVVVVVLILTVDMTMTRCCIYRGSLIVYGTVVASIFFPFHYTTTIATLIVIMVVSLFLMIV
jgi:hypothetical protein